MDRLVSVIMPEAMTSAVEKLSNDKNCSKNTLIKLAVARFLFDQTYQKPEICPSNNHTKAHDTKVDKITKEIPLDRVVSVQYTMDDGRIIRIARLSKNR